MKQPNDNLAWRTILKFRKNGLGERAFSQIYDIARTQGITFIESIKIIQNTPTLVERQGLLIKTGFEEINAELSKLKEIYDSSDEFIKFIDWLFTEYFKGNEWNELNQLIHSVISENEIESVEALASILTTPPEELGHKQMAGRINIMTMHQAKGLDADAVFIACAEDEYIPGIAIGEAQNDERRLLYVSLTRARLYYMLAIAIVELEYRLIAVGHPDKLPVT